MNELYMDMTIKTKNKAQAKFIAKKVRKVLKQAGKLDMVDKSRVNSNIRKTVEY